MTIRRPSGVYVNTVVPGVSEAMKTLLPPPSIISRASLTGRPASGAERFCRHDRYRSVNAGKGQRWKHNHNTELYILIQLAAGSTSLLKLVEVSPTAQCGTSLLTRVLRWGRVDAAMTFYTQSGNAGLRAPGQGSCQEILIYYSKRYQQTIMSISFQ